MRCFPDWLVGATRMTLSRIVRGAAIAAVLALASLWWFGGHRVGAQIARLSVTYSVERKIAALNVGVRTVELPSEKGRQLRAAIINRNFAGADQIAADILTISHLEPWRFYPFTDFIESTVDPDNPDDPSYEASLTAWVAHDPGAAMPLVVRAKYYVEIAWSKRGQGFSSDVSKANMDAFSAYSIKAMTDVEAAIQRDARNPYEFYLRLSILRGFGASKEMEAAFDDAIARYPGYYALYDVMLETLQSKWGGSVPAMYAFVDKYAGNLDASSPRKLLYVTLYRYLLETITTTCWAAQSTDSGKRDACVWSGMQNAVTPQLKNSLFLALQQYDGADRYQFALAVSDILSNAISNSGGDYPDALIQYAATSMHSNTQLAEEHPGGNNYVIDRAVAKAWYQKGYYENAVKKSEEALRDIANTTFPNEAERDIAIGRILYGLSQDSDELGQTEETIAADEAAVRIGDIEGLEKYVCYLYYKLGDYADAIRTCTSAITRGDFAMEAHYWRGAAYRDSGDTEAALKDLSVVAGSQHRLRSDAAIDMSMIFFGRKDNHSALDVLNRYQYLYDPDQSQRETLAVSYNNRCYAYMELGELRKALADCDLSLEYGSIPDAFSKKEELLKRLSIPHTQS